MRSVYGVSHNLFNKSIPASEALSDFSRLKNDFDTKRPAFETRQPLTAKFQSLVTSVGNFLDVKNSSSILGGNCPIRTVTVYDLTSADKISVKRRNSKKKQ